MAHGELFFASDRGYLTTQKSANDREVLVFGRAKIQTEATSVFGGGRTRRERMHAGPVIDAVILPVPVSGDDDDVILRTEFADLIALVGPIRVGVIVLLILAVGPDNRRRREQDFEGRVRCQYFALKPRLLFGPPDAFVRTIGHIVRAAEITAFHEPEL